MTLEERYLRCDAFLYELRDLVWKHLGKDFNKVDQELLMLMQDSTSLYQPWMWPRPSTAKKRKSTSAKKGKK